MWIIVLRAVSYIYYNIFMRWDTGYFYQARRQFHGAKYR